MVLKKIFKFRQCIFAIQYYLLLEKGGAFYLDKFESTSPKDVLCQVWLKLSQWFWKRTLLKFRCFLIISHWKRAWTFNWTKLNLFTQGEFVSSLLKIGWVVVKGVKKMAMYFYNCIMFFPWKKAWSFFYTNINPFWKDAFCQFY